METSMTKFNNIHYPYIFSKQYSSTTGYYKKVNVCRKSNIVKGLHC